LTERARCYAERVGAHKLRFWNRISYPGWLAALRAKMETEWTPQMMAVLGIGVSY
jgi:hypothetical protein